LPSASVARTQAFARRWVQLEIATLARMCESFFATLECELIERKTYATRSEARLSVFDFVEGWYNPHRLHSAIGYQSPISYEEEHHSREDREPEEPQSLVAA
jgi:putative transposase